MYKKTNVKIHTTIQRIAIKCLALLAMTAMTPAYAVDVDCNQRNPELKVTILNSWCRASIIIGYPIPNAHFGLQYKSNVNQIVGTAIGDAPSTPAHLRSFGTVAPPSVADHGTTPATASSCATLTTYSAAGIGITPVANHYYCTKFTDGTDTGYLYFYWNGTAASLSAPAVSASITLKPFYWVFFIAGFLFIGLWGQRQYSVIKKG